MNLDYSWEKLLIAVDTLACGTAPLKERIAHAYYPALMSLEPADLPSELRPVLRAIKKDLDSGSPAGDEGTLAAAVRAMSDERAVEIAHQVVSMFNAVATLCGKAGG